MKVNQSFVHQSAASSTSMASSKLGGGSSVMSAEISGSASGSGVSSGTLTIIVFVSAISDIVDSEIDTVANWGHEKSKSYSVPSRRLIAYECIRFS